MTHSASASWLISTLPFGLAADQSDLGLLLLTLPCSPCYVLECTSMCLIVFSVRLSAHRAQQEKNLEGDSGNDVSCKKVGGKLLQIVIYPLLSLVSVDIKHGVTQPMIMRSHGVCVCVCVCVCTCAFPGRRSAAERRHPQPTSFSVGAGGEPGRVETVSQRTINQSPSHLSPLNDERIGLLSHPGVPCML